MKNEMAEEKTTGRLNGNNPPSIDIGTSFVFYSDGQTTGLLWSTLPMGPHEPQPPRDVGAWRYTRYQSPHGELQRWNHGVFPAGHPPRVSQYMQVGEMPSMHGLHLLREG